MIDQARSRRPGTPAHVVAPVTLRAAVPDDHDAIVGRLDLAGSTRRLLARDLAGARPRHCVVAVGTCGLLGFMMTTRQPDEVHVLDIAVAAEVRRRGIAKLMLAWVASSSLADGATAMTLEVRASNLPAKSLYSGVGFVDRGTRPGYYQDGEDAVIMWHHDLPSLVGAAAPAWPSAPSPSTASAPPAAPPPSTATARTA